MTIRAFVLAVVDPAATATVYEGLKRVPGITEVHQVMGPYDIVAVIDAESLAAVPAIISEHIRAVDGVESTTTCVTFPEAGA